jgi:predicted RNA-binding Zn-ribbon protein involved in translation (DUF1610 family)
MNIRVTAQRNTVFETTPTFQLVVWECPVCGVVYGLSEKYADNKRDRGGSYYCPNGDSLSWTETEADKLKRQLKFAKDQAASALARADGAEASLRTTKGHVTRLRKRVIAGECPFCGQHLRDLARHVGRVHPDETAEQDA